MICSKCGQDLPPEEFWPSCRGRKKNECKQCLSKRFREYYQKNKERFAKHNHQYYSEGKEKILESCHQYHLKNKEHIHKRKHEYYLRNKEHVNKHCQQYQSKNKDKIAEQRHDYYGVNKEKIQEKNRRYYGEGYNEVRRVSKIEAKVNGKMQVVRNVTKRSYSSECELCGRTLNSRGQPVKLIYHHWGEVASGQKVKGIWVCTTCHVIVEHPELTKRLLDRFLALKAIIDQQVAKAQAKLTEYTNR
jgi:hypothetical protein